MTPPIERLQNALTTLGLKVVEARLDALLEQAAKKEPSYAEFLEEVVEVTGHGQFRVRSWCDTGAKSSG